MLLFLTIITYKRFALCTFVIIPFAFLIYCDTLLSSVFVVRLVLGPFPPTPQAEVLEGPVPVLDVDVQANPSRRIKVLVSRLTLKFGHFGITFDGGQVNIVGFAVGLCFLPCLVHLNQVVRTLHAQGEGDESCERDCNVTV